MFNNFASLSGNPCSYPADTVDTNDRKRAPVSSSTLNDVQPLKSSKRLKTQPVNTNSLGDMRRYTSEPYATDIISIRNSDILMGGRAVAKAHRGNTQLRNLVTHSLQALRSVNFTTYKSIANDLTNQTYLGVLQEIHSSTPRGRFLQYNKNNYSYDEISDERAIEKIARISREVKVKTSKNVSTSTENNSAGIAQQGALENLQDSQPVAISYHYYPNHHPYPNHHSYLNHPCYKNYVDYHLGKLHSHQNSGMFVGHSLEGNNDQKPAATPNNQISDEFEPIPYHDAASREESNLEEPHNNLPEHLFSAQFSENNNDQEPVEAPTDTQASQPTSRAKKRWTEAEDNALIAEKFRLDQAGTKKRLQWFLISKLIPLHSPKAIRERWVNHLNPILDKSLFNYGDFDQIKTGVEKYGRKWSQISQDIFESRRSENDIKNQFYSASFKSFIIDLYGIDTYSQLQDKSAPE